MNQYCKTKRKAIVLQMDISGKMNQDQLYVAGSDNDNDLENLGGDSNTEFIPVTEKAREALITSDNNIEVEDTTTTSTTGYVQRPSLDMENLEAVVHDIIAELSPVSSPTSSRISNRTNKSIRKRKLFHENDLTDRNMAVPTTKSKAKKCKMLLKRLQSPSTPTPSAVNDHEVHNKINSCLLRLKTTITECC